MLGYGDINAQNDGERKYSIVTAFVGTGLFAYILTTGVERVGATANAVADAGFAGVLASGFTIC